MTVVQLRGTSGSGKSTIVREIISMRRARGDELEKIYEEGRKQPLAYRLSGRPGVRPLVIIGHYETACGGCDTIASMDKIFNLVKFHYDLDCDVLFEGLLISAELNRTASLHEYTDGAYYNITLDTPLDICIAGIMERRQAKKGPDAPQVNPKNTTSKHKQVIRNAEVLGQKGFNVQVLTRDAARARVLELVG